MVQQQNRYHQSQQYRKRTQCIIIYLSAFIILFTFPYVAFNVSLIRTCSPICTAKRLMASLLPEDPQLRRADCRNESARLLRAFGLHRRRKIDLTKPTYVMLTSPTDVSGSCIDDNAPQYRRDVTTKSTADDACFNQTYLMDDKRLVYPVLHRLQQNFTQRGLEIFMSDGSLLGSQRHFGIIPWDDDIDFVILREQKFEVRELLIELSHLDEFSFEDTEKINFHWRLDFLCQVDKTKPPEHRYGLSHLFPYKVCKISTDLFFGEVHGDQFLRLEMPYVYNMKDVYPLQLLPFGPYLMRAPANPRAMSAAQYGRDYEFSCVFEIHTQRFQCPDKFLECSRLRRVYPFVRHTVLRLRDGQSVFADILVWKSEALGIFIPPQLPIP